MRLLVALSLVLDNDARLREDGTDDGGPMPVFFFLESAESERGAEEVTEMLNELGGTKLELEKVESESSVVPSDALRF